MIIPLNLKYSTISQHAFARSSNFFLNGWIFDRQKRTMSHVLLWRRTFTSSTRSMTDTHTHTHTHRTWPRPRICWRCKADCCKSKVLIRSRGHCSVPWRTAVSHSSPSHLTLTSTKELTMKGVPSSEGSAGWDRKKRKVKLSALFVTMSELRSLIRFFSPQLSETASIPSV